MSGMHFASCLALLDTRSARRVFSDVHATGENDLHFIRACGRELCEAFVYSLTATKYGCFFAGIMFT